MVILFVMVACTLVVGGAWLLEPYADKPGDTGRNTTTVAEIKETARLALEHGFQLCVHAIGDRANRETLDIFEEAFKGRDGRSLRLGHVQLLGTALAHPLLFRSVGVALVAAVAALLPRGAQVLAVGVRVLTP